MLNAFSKHTERIRPDICCCLVSIKTSKINLIFSPINRPAKIILDFHELFLVMPAYLCQILLMMLIYMLHSKVILDANSSNFVLIYSVLVST